MGDEEFYPGKKPPLAEDIDSVTQEYLSTLDIPEDKYSPQFILCVVGDMGSGKTTVLKMIGNSIPFVRIANDDIRKLLFDKGFFPTFANEVSWKLVELLANQGYSLASDWNCLSFAVGERKTLFENFVTQNKIRAVWLYVNPPSEYIINKLTALDKKLGSAPWLFRNGAPSVERYLAKKMNPSLIKDVPFIYSIDTSKEKLAEEIETVSTLIKSKLLE